MPQSRNRPGHPHQKQSAIPARQRVKGRVIWAILFAIFAGLIAFFAAGDNLVVLVIAAAAGAALGYIVGKNMEQDAKKG
jgi:1,4-dihydroxy-2-naphthoate octaprenyltransferase